MTLITLLITLVAIGIVLYVINTLIPMDPKMKTIVNIVVVCAVLLWLLQSFGFIGPTIHVR